MKGHYLMLVLPDGKQAVQREYVELAREDESLDEALDRWVEQRMAGRQRNRAKVGGQLRASVLEARLCRPTSWHRAQCEADGVAFPRPVGKGRRRRRA